MADDSLQQVKDRVLAKEAEFEEYQERMKEILRKKNSLVEKMIKSEDLKKAEDLRARITEDHH